jgi:hypoxanthine-DNA glycosylase
MTSQGERSSGFAPLASNDARVLILGSLPSQRSIADNEYYAHPQNAFWRIMREIVGADGSYADRCAALQRERIALWDVLASSVRPGSLDADIQMSTANVNDFEQFLADHVAIERICFNGQKSAKIFSDRVPQEILDSRVQLLTMPSTSPAHAAMRFDEKLKRWRKGINLAGCCQILV